MGNAAQPNGAPARRELQHCDADIDAAARVVTFKQRRSRLSIMQEEVTVPLWMLKQLVGQLTILEGAGEQGGRFGSCGQFDAATRKVATLAQLPGEKEMRATLGDVAPFKVLAGRVLEVEGKEEEAGRYVPAMAVPVAAAADAALGHSPTNPQSPQ